MKAKRHRQRGVASTTLEAKLSQSLGDLGDGLYGDAAWDYVNRYIQLKAQSFELQKKGLKVRISLPDFPGQPLLIIEK